MIALWRRTRLRGHLPMAQETTTATTQSNEGPFRGAKPYDDWINSLGLPIHRGYYIEDARTAEVEWWEVRQAKVAILQLAGQQGAAEARITEVPPGATLPAARFGFDESVYVA